MTRSSPKELRSSLVEHCRLRGWKPRFIGQPGSHYGLLEVLEEVIACRDVGANLLSLELIDLAEAQGWRNPWLDDNRAWLLLADKKYDAARQIWRRLSHCEIPSLCDHAKNTLEALAGVPEIEQVVDQLIHLRARDDLQGWQELCWKSLVDCGDMFDGRIYDEVLDAALTRSPANGAPWDKQLLLHDQLIELFNQALVRWESL